MSQLDEIKRSDLGNIREMLCGSGYSDKAIEYYLKKTQMGILTDANQVTELTGPCGDTMKIYLKLIGGRVENAKIQVLGCPGAIASAMAAMELIRGKTIEEAVEITDRDIFRMLGEIPDEKQHCIRLTNKTIQKAIEEYRCKRKDNPKGG